MSGSIFSNSAPASTGHTPATAATDAAGASTVAVCHAVKGQIEALTAAAAKMRTAAAVSDLRPTPGVVVSADNRLSNVRVPKREYRMATPQRSARSPANGIA